MYFIFWIFDILIINSVQFYYSTCVVILSSVILYLIKSNKKNKPLLVFKNYIYRVKNKETMYILCNNILFNYITNLKKIFCIVTIFVIAIIYIRYKRLYCYNCYGKSTAILTRYQ